jgi:hypothetical protein
MNTGEIILYETEDGITQISLRAVNGTVWLTQKEMAQLFDVSTDNISLHLKNLYQEGEISEQATTEEYSAVQKEGSRDVQRTVKLYNLDAILAVGYRVRSARGIQFRKWANTVLKEYLVKGFAMNDERLKQADQWDYFDEWLARIRDIRASEKRFYQKVKDLYATAVDYDKTSEEAQLFFKKVQNKMLWAVTGQTAAELIVDRSNSKKHNMGLTAWQGTKLRKADTMIAKNYLNQDELNQLNRIVVMYLDYAEEQAVRRKTITMTQWQEKLDAFLQFNEHKLLTHAGKVQMTVAQQLVMERYEAFDAERKKAELFVADAEDLREIEALVKGLEINASEK